MPILPPFHSTRGGMSQFNVIPGFGQQIHKKTLAESASVLESY
jgi:hypothetical protein